MQVFNTGKKRQADPNTVAIATMKIRRVQRLYHDDFGQHSLQHITRSEKGSENVPWWLFGNHLGIPFIYKKRLKKYWELRKWCAPLFLFFRYASRFFSATFVQMNFSRRKGIRKCSLMALWKAPGHTFHSKKSFDKILRTQERTHLINNKNVAIGQFISQFFACDFPNRNDKMRQFHSLYTGCGWFPKKKNWHELAT